MRVPASVSSFARNPNRGTARTMLDVARVRWAARREGEGRGDRARVDVEYGHHGPDATVVVYFADDPRRLYQLQQWLPVLEELHARHPVQLVFRDLRSMRAVAEQSPLPAVYVRRLADLSALYAAGHLKVAVYVNNGVSNFQSLAVPTMLHVHVNHGESDKVCMVSNQAKAYDRVFVAGEAAVRRHRAALIDFDESRLVRVGRPQLDLDFPPALPVSDRRTVLYAPTWEGENAANNYTSVDRFGPRIVRDLLGLDGIRVVYRPHPRVVTSPTPEIRSAHDQIMASIAAAADRDPGAGHRAALDGSILALFERCDAIVTDVSSVGLDFLYLRTAGPIFVTDRRDDRALLAVDAPFSVAADVIDSSTLDGFGETVAARFDHDTLAAERVRLRGLYFGDLAPGESTRRFMEAIDAVVAERDALLAARPQHHVGPAEAMGGSDDEGSQVPAAGERLSAGRHGAGALDTEGNRPAPSADAPAPPHGVFLGSNG